MKGVPIEDLEIAGSVNVPTVAATSGTVIRIERRNPSSRIPLSFSQEQFWLLDQLAPATPVYNIGEIIDFHGEFNAEAMSMAIEELVRRHEILRTTFSHSGGYGAQVVLPEMDVPHDCRK